MRITVSVVPRAKNVEVTMIREGYYKVAVKEPQIRGKANRGLIAALADHFGVTKSQVNIVIGKTNREKLVEIRE